MECYKIEKLTFRYPAAKSNAIENISLTVNEGEFVTICGKSGSGKSTLVRHLKPSDAPCGIKSGRVFFMGEEISNLDFRTQSEKIGFVSQSPDNQIVTDKVWHELAFGPESLGMPTRQIRARVAEMASFFGIQSWFHKDVSELSGGQKQLLNLASVMVMQPSVLILDEPTSQLDPIAAQDFFEALAKLNREIGTTVILTEHRPEEAFGISDRVIVMEDGCVIADDKPSRVGKKLWETNNDMFASMSTAMRIYARIDGRGEYPVTVRAGRRALEEYNSEHGIDADRVPKRPSFEHNGNAVIELRDVFFRYEKNMPDVLQNLSLKVYRGEMYTILGGNGTGKTTALSVMSGLNKPRRGKVYIDGEKIENIKDLYNGCIGVLPQKPQSLFVKKTVQSDLYEMLSDKKMSKDEKDKAVAHVTELCQIKDLLERHPYDLSGGEGQRAAIAKILLLKPRILLLDEPTKGLDAHFKMRLGKILMNLKERGVTIVMVSHDVEFCAEYADRCAMFFDGEIVSEGAPTEFFSGKSFYTTAANRMARQLVPKAILADEVVIACGGKAEQAPKDEKEKCEKIKEEPTEKNQADTGRSEENENKKNRAGKKKPITAHSLLSVLFVLVAVPLTIAFGIYFLSDRKYYFISLLIIAEILIPFFMRFEKRKPQVGEVVTISVLCAIAVAGRAAFYMVPQFKPAAAVVIIAGACFGGETGFLVGALTAFISNFFFGQGPWTPWQMFAFGMIGYLAGVLFGNGFIRKRKCWLCIYGGLATLVIYGGIMNLAAVLMQQTNPSVQMLISIYAAGLPFDIVHMLSTIVFLYIVSKPMIEKINRVKQKYGIADDK